MLLINQPAQHLLQTSSNHPQGSPVNILQSSAEGGPFIEAKGELSQANFPKESATGAPPKSPKSVARCITPENRVRFKEQLVDRVWLRPYTEEEDIGKLFYSSDETQAFRQDYKLERRLLAVAAAEDDDKSIHRVTVNNNSKSVGCGVLTRKRPIAMVVVKHNDTLEAFHEEPFYQPAQKYHQFSNENHSFDNDSFWNGSLTWC